MIRRLLRRFASDTSSEAGPINLIGDVAGQSPNTPDPIGIDTPPQATGWTAARLEQIFRRCNDHPGDPQVQLEARHARHRLSSFWLAAPIDQLEIFYHGAIGRAFREMLLGSLPGLPLAPDEARWKESLARRLQDHFDAPERPNLLLAVMPYCAPGRMRLENPLTSLPPWLLADYSHCFDPELSPPLSRQAVLPQTAASQVALVSNAHPLSAASSMQQRSVQVPGAAAAAGVALDSLPVLSARRGAEAFAAFEDSEFTDRMIGLINLFRIDPGDREVVGELRMLRRLIGQVWLDVTPASLEALYRSSLGQIYRELLASDFGALTDETEDLALRQSLTQVAVNQDHPSMAQALLAVMPFYPQGKMRLGAGQARLPGWLRQEFAALSGLTQIR